MKPKNDFNILISNKLYKNRKLQARALIYAVFISFFIAIIVGTIIVFTQFHSYYIDRSIVKDKLESNAESGIIYAVSTPDFFYDSDTKKIDLYGENEDTVLLERKLFGAYEIIHSKTTQNKFKAEITALIGSNPITDSKIAVYLPEQNNELTLCGKTFIKGNCYLPKHGVDKGCIGSNNFLGDRLINGNILLSDRRLPELNNELLRFTEKYFSKNFTAEDSLLYLNTVKTGDTIQNSFKNKPLILVNEENLKLSKNYKGNIILVSHKPVEIRSSARINDLIIFAPFIEVQSGFEGSVQLFAQDSLRIREKVKLNPTSFIGVFGKTGAEQNTLIIEKNCRIAGTIILTGKNIGQNNILSIEEETIINGLVWCNGYTELKYSTVYGSIYTKNFVTRKNSFQADKLEDVTIDRSKLSNFFSGGLIFKENRQKKIIKWLN